MTPREMIEVLEAAERGEEIQSRKHLGGVWTTVPDVRNIAWDFFHQDFRVKPKLLEGWANVYKKTVGHKLFKTRREAQYNAGLDVSRPVLMREVPEE